ncbi:hypothetical protein ANCDUO_05391 [Ancylostoma duodenale]|uniref:Sulfur globule protein CV3 domain protein n=1 Tax=Ancylostoma duodenale TaxID=51022 RepID=A0A0C2GYR9_9BILA|nr:hypothetical protein ANCDUO_05391 [Ancylostoma duodenale]
MNLVVLTSLLFSILLLTECRLTQEADNQDVILRRVKRRRHGYGYGYGYGGGGGWFPGGGMFPPFGGGMYPPFGGGVYPPFGGGFFPYG